MVFKDEKLDVEETLNKLTMKQKITLLAGQGWWQTEPVPEAGVDSMRLSDGPNGVRGTRFFNGVPSSCFPSSTGLGSSFDIELAREVGEALGEECRAKSTHILLAPTVNTQRSPLGGRGFESFSEDPHLNGNIAAAYINGVQSKGVSATIKHYVTNDQEFERFSIDSVVSERALREIYLKPFQIAIRKANPWALMTAYNRLNGLHVSENPRVIDEILRKEWGFKGMIMSDWIGVYSTAESIKAGLDLEMPGPTIMRGKAVERALISQKLFPEDIDARVRKILELLVHAHESGIPFNGPEKGVDTPSLRSLLRRAASSAVVLLKNDNDLLPLSLSGKKKLKKIAVIGPNAKTAFVSGGGSANLLASWKVSPLQGIQTFIKEEPGENVKVEYAEGGQTHKLYPLLDGHISLPEGTPKSKNLEYENGGGEALVEFWNEEPAKGWVGDVGLKEEVECDWSTGTGSSYCFLMDGIDEGKVKEICWIRYSTTFTVPVSGTYAFSISLTGHGTLSINDKLLIDLSRDPPLGDSFFGLGTEDVKASCPTPFKAGDKVKVELRVSNASFMARGAPFATRGGIRLGGVREVEEAAAIEEAVKVAKDADVAIVVVGLNHELESEGFDREDMKLPGATNQLVPAILNANPNTIVINQSGTPVEMPWVDQAHTLLQAFYGGNELGNGLADVLFGKVNPSGKLAITFPKRLEDNPSYPSFGHLPESHGKVIYNEGVFVGYRSYDKRGIDPLFPFGYGLSYTTFSYTNLIISPLSITNSSSSSSNNLSLTVTFTITNTGSRPGSESAQIYISHPSPPSSGSSANNPRDKPSLPHPPVQLKGFVKTKVIDAGEKEEVSVELDREALEGYEERRGRWVVERRVYGVMVGRSSRDLVLRGEVEVKEGIEWVGL